MDPLVPFAHRLFFTSQRQTQADKEGKGEEEGRGREQDWIGLDRIGSGTRWEGLGGVVARVLLHSPAGNQWPSVGNCGVLGDF